MLAPPTEKQFNDLVAFLISPSPDLTVQCPLPIEITMESKWRWRTYAAMTQHQVLT